MKNNGGLNSTTFSNSCSLKRKLDFLDFLAIFPSQILSIILISEKNLFTTAVSIPKSFHLAQQAKYSEIHQPTLMSNVSNTNLSTTDISQRKIGPQFFKFRLILLICLLLTRITVLIDAIKDTSNYRALSNEQNIIFF